MILLVHMALGAAMGATIKNPVLAILLALASHYFLDFFPHIEYSVQHIKSNDWKKSMPDILKVALDFLLGLGIIFITSDNTPVIYLAGFTALIPDGLTILSQLFPNRLLAIHDTIHTQMIHYLTKQKPFPVFWKMATQIIASVISIYLLIYYS